MIQLTSAGKRFGQKLLFQDLDWLITPQDRIGLVGGNGTGKSTLLKILAGLDSLDDGAITFTKGTTLGYLPQDGLNVSGRTVFDEVMHVFAHVHQMEKEMESLAHQMGEVDHESKQYLDIADRYQHLDAQFRAENGYALEAQAGAVLMGLGFKKEDWTRQTEEFSGGWQMRIALAKLLLQKPNLLLLDEPTNHLDLETRNWLEDFLNSYPHAVILISHDRFFLDVTVKKISEIWNKRVFFYHGNYDKYLSQKSERKSQLESAKKNQDEKIEQLQLFINRFRAQATKAKQVQSKIKELERIERIEIPPEEKAIHFRFPQPKPSGRRVIEAHGITKYYGEKRIFEYANFVIERGDRIALVGPNGAGKSTLIRILAGTEPLTGGRIELGYNVEPDYFAQDQYKALDTDSRILDDLGMVSPLATQTELRTLLGCFLFSDDDVFKPIGVLSGGERNRYALARMLQHPSNFLLLDEPTNHLDLRAKDVLLQALKDFTGTSVFVSHDRYFIDQLATKVFEVGDGDVHVFPGNYEDYLYRKSREGQAAAAAELAKATQAASQNGNSAAPDKGKRVNPLKLKKMQERRHELEAEVSRTENEIVELEEGLTVFVSAEETAKQTRSLNDAKSKLEKLLAEWEEVSEIVDANAEP